MDPLLNLIYYPDDPYKTICSIVLLVVCIEFISLITSYLGRMGRR